MEWIVFEHNGSDILRISLPEATLSEVRETVSLLAYERECDKSEIAIRVATY